MRNLQMNPLLKKIGLTLFVAGIFPALTTAQTVIEYVNIADFPLAPGGQYFYTSDPGEQAFVDSGGAGRFKRTGAQFLLGGSDPVCRFYGSVSPGPNSHFYTVLPDECNALKAAQVSPKPATIQQWNYEGSPLRATLPIKAADGSLACAAGLRPIYRAYNNAYPKAGGKNAWDSNHRLSARAADVRALTNTNWVNDGITLCVPPGADETAQLPSSSASVADQCSAPRAEAKYGDKQGTLDTEKNWVRAFVDDRYLWTSDSPRFALDQAASAEALFVKRLNPLLTAAGGKVDRFSNWTRTSDFENAQQGNIGGYGWSLSAISNSPPRNYVVRYVEPGGPADTAGISRGMKITEIDGQDFVNGGNLTIINSGFSPILDSTHSFGFQKPDGSTYSTMMTARNVARIAAQTVKTLDTASGKVGYLHYTTFNTYPSEGQLVQAMREFKAQNITDLVLDLRYNGGGFIYISAQMAYMVAGAQSAGKDYYKFTYNDKRLAETNNPSGLFPFRNTESGFTNTSTSAGFALPALNLPRVYVLIGTGTASASEAVINGLRGIGVEAILIGATTTGKPYGSLPTDNCGITYSMLEFKGTNAIGYGDFGDGFAPTCTVADDLNRALGDPAESRLSAALAHRATGQCPTGTRASDFAKSAPQVIDAPAAPFEEPMGGAFLVPPRKDIAR